MLEVSDLSAGYPGKDVLRDFSAVFPTGRLTVLAGPNGCGKSTLLKTLCAIVPARSGQIRLEDEDLLALPARELAQKVAYLAQSRQIPDITAFRLVLHGRFPYLSYPRRYRKEDLAAARGAMEQMGISHLADVPLQNLSGGQRQKVYIAMALAQNTPVILLDEPTTYLDVRHQLHLMDQARQLADSGKTVIMVLHDLSLALRCADHLILMDQGRAICQGSCEEVYASGLLGSVFGVQVSRVQTESGWHYYYQGGNNQ